MEKEGATKIELDDAKAALSELEADDLVVVQAKAPAGANSSATSQIIAALEVDPELRRSTELAGEPQVLSWTE